MKPSGIEWIGDIPDDWEVKKLKYVSELDPSISEFLSDNDIVSFVPMECLGEQTLSPYETEYGKVKGKYTYFANEDIIMAKVTPCFENGNIAIAKNLKNNVGFGSSELFVFRTKSVSNSFLMYTLYSEPFKSLAKSTMYGTGGLKRVSPNFILNYKIPFPPLKTQQKIADYLDEKCGEIDATIAKQKESIEKLKAYKQSLISETVTKGLDKFAPLKPSGIDYLGDIPNDWEVIKTKFLFNVYGGSTPKVNVPEYWGDKITWITPGELGDDIKIVLNSKRMLSEKGLNSCGATLVSKGSIIISNRAPIGQVCLAGSELCTNQGCKSLVAKIKLSCLFFYYFFKVQSEVLNMLGNGTTFMELSTSDLLNFKIPCPTIKEQQKIADYLDSKCSQIDKYITEKQNIIQKLDAYKKSLIFEYVTGKQKI